MEIGTVIRSPYTPQPLAPAPAPASPQPLPLDLTLHEEPPTTNSIVSVIQSAIKKPVMPTCTNPNLNSNYIALKFGAAVGPNRMSYPREFKLMVIDYYYANGQNKYRTCKEFQITKSMLNGWLQKMEKIKQSRPGSLKSGRSGRRPQFPDIEKQLYSLYQAHLLSGQKVGNRWIRDTARNLAQQQCSKEELAGMCQFSERWLSNFKKRYHINLNRDWSSNSSMSGGSSGSSSGGMDQEQEQEETPATSEDTTSQPTDGSSLSIDEEANFEEDEASGSDSLSGISFPEDSATPPPTTTATPPPVSSEIPVITSAVSADLPIHQFYRQYPWLCRRPPSLNYEPGRRGRKVQFPQVEKVLYERLLQRQAGGHRVSNRWLQEEARGLAAKLCPEVLAEATKSARCMFSEHWLHNFKKRYGVSLKQQLVTSPDTNTSPTLPPAPPLSTNPSLFPSAPEGMGGSNPMALAAVLQMQQWILQQCYLKSLAASAGYSTPSEANPGMLSQSLLASGVNLAEWYSKTASALATQNLATIMDNQDIPDKVKEEHDL